MKIIQNKKSKYTNGAVCALGSFDGVHIGHRQIIERIKNVAGGIRKAGVITFSPLPASVIRHAGIYYLTTEQEKEEILARLNIDFIFYFDFTAGFSRQDPAEFVKLLRTMVTPSAVIVGDNFHFGQGGKGTAKMLGQLAGTSFNVEIFPQVKDSRETISSTRIRELLLLGNIPAANRLLGREYAISGAVVKGMGKGAKLGFPTINIEVQKEKLLPLDGVYAVKVEHGSKLLDGAMFCAHNIVEVHILDFSKDLYGKKVVVRLVNRIRAVGKFSSDESLRDAIAQDVKIISDRRAQE